MARQALFRNDTITFGGPPWDKELSPFSTVGAKPVSFHASTSALCVADDWSVHVVARSFAQITPDAA